MHPSKHGGMTVIARIAPSRSRQGRSDDQLDAGVELERGGVEHEAIVTGIAGVALVEVLAVRLPRPVGLAEELACFLLVDLLESDGPLDARLGRPVEAHVER